jgi:hypothetical protein
MEHWQRRDLSARRYVYFWADGVYFSPRLDHDKQCMCVITGADPRSPWSKSLPKRRAIPALADDRLPPVEGISSKSRNHDQRA